MNTFSKEERLSQKIHIDKLMDEGKSFNMVPFRVVWMIVEKGTVPAKILISVPKRNFKKAVHRNYIKRLIRECYRKNKNTLYENVPDCTIHFMIMYNIKTKIEYLEMEQKMKQVLELLSKKLNAKT
jgi:ribonuclease P protein component